MIKNIRLLDFLKLLEQLNKGVNQYKLDKKQIKELHRLEKLFFKLMPDSCGQIINTRHKFSKTGGRHD